MGCAGPPSPRWRWITRPARSRAARCRSAIRSTKNRRWKRCCRPVTRGCTPRSPTAARAGCRRRSARWPRSWARRLTWRRVPLKYAGLRPWEIWLSEAQERMVLAVPPANWPAVQAICDGLDIEATVLGRFTGDGRLTLRYDGRIVGEIDADFLHNGIPRRRLQAVWQRPERDFTAETQRTQRHFCSISALSAPLRWTSDASDATSNCWPCLPRPTSAAKRMSSAATTTKCRAATVVKPFAGHANAGPSDAAVLDLRFATGRGQASGQGSGRAEPRRHTFRGDQPGTRRHRTPTRWPGPR